MANVLQILPELEGDEQIFVQSLIKDLDENKAYMFANAYRSRRKDPTLLLLVTFVGFIGIAGIQRFLVGQIGMGILYLFTGGLCGIGTIIDLVTHRNIAFSYNQKVALELINLIRTV